MELRTVDQAEVAGSGCWSATTSTSPWRTARSPTTSGCGRPSRPCAGQLDHGARVICCSHLGRPKGKRDPAYSLEPVRPVLAERLGVEVAFVDDVAGDQARQAAEGLGDGQVLLQNLRYEPGEEKNDPELAGPAGRPGRGLRGRRLRAAHRAHASVVGVAERLIARAGYLLAGEVKELSRLLEDPERPFVAVLGAARSPTSWPCSTTSSGGWTAWSWGGGMCFTFLAAQGHEIGDSLFEPDQLEERPPAAADGRQPGQAGAAAQRRGGGPRGQRGRPRPAPCPPTGSRPAGRAWTSARRRPRRSPPPWPTPARCSGTGPWACSSWPRSPPAPRAVAEAVAAAAGYTVVGVRLGRRPGRARPGRPGRPPVHRRRGQPAARGQDPARRRRHPVRLEGPAAARRPLIAGNWKMHKTHLEGIQLTQKLAWSLTSEDTDAGVEVAVCPPFTALRAVGTLIDGDRLPIALGAQDCHPEPQGAYTGEVSAPMLAALGVQYVIVGYLSAASTRARTTSWSTARPGPCSAPACSRSSASATPWRSARPAAPRSSRARRLPGRPRRPGGRPGGGLRAGAGHRHRPRRHRRRRRPGDDRRHPRHRRRPGRPGRRRRARIQYGGQRQGRQRRGAGRQARTSTAPWSAGPASTPTSSP